MPKYIYYISFLTLHLFIDTSDAFTTSDLAVICGLVNGTDIITKPPQECTALALPTKNLDQLKKVIAIKGNLPVMLIDDSQDYYSWPEIVKKSASEYLADISTLGVDYVVFDDMYKDTRFKNDERLNFSQNVALFIDDAKCQFPEIGFGIVLNDEMNWLKESLDIAVLNEHVDLFLLNSASYRVCVSQTNQADMEVLATVEDISGQITELKASGMDSTKLIYTIQLKIDSVKTVLLSVSNEDISYSTLCGKKMSDHRKYCFSTIKCLFDKARIRIAENTMGIYINGIEYDDIDGACGCTGQNGSDAEYRGLKIIAGASQENKNDEVFYECIEGEFPVIL